ncbi:hypothetical protein MVEG_06465 [Podila verticillata NRRL 6337]|nr:hypothetical protein MVEG_06465 [Podila verticillata NRRL 6337]
MAYTESRSAPIAIYSRPNDFPLENVVSTRRSFTSMSPMGGATGAMKKFLNRRRGNTGDGYGSTENLPRLQAFEIVGGNGSISPGTMVYDVEPLQSPRSSVKISLITNSPTSPKSPTLQTMFSRFGRDKAHPRLGSVTEIGGTQMTEARKKLYRRSLSADNVLPFRMESDFGNGVPKDQTIHPLAMGPSDLNGNAIPSSVSEGSSHLANNTSANALLESDPEFYHNSVEFLNTHHSRSYTEDWAKRNKRHTGLSRRQSESSLLNIISEKYGSSDHSCGVWDSTLGVGASSSDSLPLPLVSLSSPTQYYDCPQTRNVVRFYLANNEYQFDEMLDSGFPSRSLRLPEETEDSHFMTLRLTLTPWHARAEESMLYGPENTSKPPHLRSMVYKLFSRSSSSLLMSALPPTPSSVSSNRPPHVAKDSTSSTGMDDIGRSSDRSLSRSSAISSMFNSFASSYTPGESSVTQRKKLRGPLKDKGFRIIATPVTDNPLSPSRDHQYLSSPPLTPVQPRSGSLSALSLPLYTSDELSPPIPPRRKVSTPALFYSLTHGNTSSLSLPETIERPRSAVPTKSGLRKAAITGFSADIPLVDSVATVALQSTRYPHRDYTPPSARQWQPQHKCSDPTLNYAKTTVESDVNVDISSDELRYDSPPVTPPSPLQQTDDSRLSIRNRQQLLRSHVSPKSPHHQPDVSSSRPSPDHCHKSAPSTPMNPHVLAPWQYQESVPTDHYCAWTPSQPGDVQFQRSNNDLQQYQQHHYNLQQQQQRWHQSRAQQQQEQPPSPLHHQAKHPLSPTAIDGRDGSRIFSYAHPRPHDGAQGSRYSNATKDEPNYAPAPRRALDDRKRNMSVPCISGPIAMEGSHRIQPSQSFVFP